MKKFLTLILMLGLSIPVFAQGNSGDHGNGNGDGNGNGNGQGNQLTPDQIAAKEVAFLSALLSLTPDQQNQATPLFKTAETAKAGLQADIDTQQGNLVKAIIANSASGMNTAIAAIASDTSKILTADATAQAAFNHLLTADQQAKYAKFITGEFDFPGNSGGHPNPGHGHSGH